MNASPQNPYTHEPVPVQLEAPDGNSVLAPDKGRGEGG